MVYTGSSLVDPVLLWLVFSSAAIFNISYPRCNIGLPLSLANIEFYDVSIQTARVINCLSWCVNRYLLQLWYHGVIWSNGVIWAPINFKIIIQIRTATATVWLKYKLPMVQFVRVCYLTDLWLYLYIYIHIHIYVCLLF